MYPVGIPLLYAFILWKNRHSLNPRVRADANADEGISPGPDLSSSWTKHYYFDKESATELHEKLEKRRENPELVPSMFLWKDFGESLQKRGCSTGFLRQNKIYGFSARAGKNDSSHVSDVKINTYSSRQGLMSKRFFFRPRRRWCEFLPKHI